MDIKSALDSGIEYQDYITLLEELVGQNQTTGNENSEGHVDYTRLNLRRMSRIYKTAKIDPELAELIETFPFELIWLVLTEGWCGDAAQSIPAIGRMASLSTQISLKIVSRDEFPEIMDHYLTNGAKSIPKLICFNRELNELGNWGPRPDPAQQMLLDYKKNQNEPYDVFQQKLQMWYNNDQTKTIQEEFKIALSSWKKV